MTRIFSFLSILAILGMLFSCSYSPLSNSSIYVSTSGSDNNDGLSPSKPVRSLVKAVSILLR